MAIFKPPAGWRLNEIKGTHFEPLIILEVCLGSEVAVCWNVCMYVLMRVQCTCVYKEDMWDAPDLNYKCAPIQLNKSTPWNNIQDSTVNSLFSYNFDCLCALQMYNEH